MPVANYKTYCAMLDRARAGRFAFPAINVTSLTTANAVLRGLAESKSDGIIQVSTGGGAFASGSSLKDMALGAIAIAEHVHRAAERYPIYVALHTDHCLKDKLDSLHRPFGIDQQAQVIGGMGHLGVGLERGPQMLLRLFLFSHFGFQQAQIEVGCCIVGLDLEGLGKHFLRVLGITGTGVGH